MQIALKTAGLMALIAYPVDNVASFLFGLTVFLYAFVVPVVEESARYYAAGRFCWTAEPRKAALIGLLIGLIEIGTRTFEGLVFAPVEFRSPLAYAVNSGSVPIHVALSMAFYAIWHGRWWKMVALHVLINGTGAALWLGLAGKVEPLTYVATALATITALCAVIGLLALWRMRLRAAEASRR
jgi:hypothetical protein